MFALILLAADSWGSTLYQRTTNISGSAFQARVQSTRQAGSNLQCAHLCHRLKANKQFTKRTNILP